MLYNTREINNLYYNNMKTMEAKMGRLQNITAESKPKLMIIGR